ncbi:hypothetical protein BH23ACT5_BH23ACT5_06800 [soil metagenome]
MDQSQGVRPLALTADPRLAVYFYSRLESPDWLEPLRSQGAFQAPGQRFWSQGQYLKRVAGAHPDEVLELMHAVVQSSDLFGYLALQTAASIGPAALSLVQTVVERTRDTDGVGIAFTELINAWGSAGHKAVMPRLADISLNLSLDGGSRRATGTFSDHEVGRVVSRLVELCDPGALSELAQVLIWKIEKVFRAGNESEYRMFSLERQTVYGSDADTFTDRPISALIDGLRDTLARMRDTGVPLQVRGALLGLDYELFTRIWQNHLAEVPGEHLHTSRSVLLAAMKTWATPESLRLLGGVWPLLDEDRRAALLGELGDPTLADLAGDWQSDDDLHRELLRVRQWLVAVADEAPEQWKTAYGELVEVFGSPDPEAVAFRIESFVGTPSPLGVDEVTSLGPLGLIEWVSGWEPGEGFRSPTPEMLGRTIAESVGQDAATWIPDLVSTIEGLREPVYIRGLFAGFTEAAKESQLAAQNLEAILVAAELAWSEPWHSALELQDRFDFDPIGLGRNSRSWISWLNLPERMLRSQTMWTGSVYCSRRRAGIQRRT